MFSTQLAALIGADICTKGALVECPSRIISPYTRAAEDIRLLGVETCLENKPLDAICGLPGITSYPRWQTAALGWQQELADGQFVIAHMRGQ